MKNKNHTSSTPQQEYVNFFLQLPAVDYLDDIKAQEDLEQQPRDLAVHGLSDEQVSQIAVDSLRDARRSQRQDTDQSKPTPPQPNI